MKKSEPEGENAEELEGLATHDEEGEWCWPKKRRVTGWGRRIDSRPAVHYLAEEDEDEQVSSGLNHLASRSAAGTQWTWKKVTVVDSGAAENVMTRSMSRDQTHREVRVQGTRGREHQELREADHVRLACDLPSFLAARSRARSCSHKLSAKSLSTSGWARQKSRQPLSFPRFSRAWWTNLNRCRKSVIQLGHVEVSPIFRERVHRRPCFFLACWSLAFSEMKCSPHSQHVHGLTTGWLLTRDSSPFLSNVLSLKCKPPTRARHFFSSSAAFSQLFSHPGS